MAALEQPQLEWSKYNRCVFNAEFFDILFQVGPSQEETMFIMVVLVDLLALWGLPHPYLEKIFHQPENKKKEKAATSTTLQIGCQNMQSKSEFAEAKRYYKMIFFLYF